MIRIMPPYPVAVVETTERVMMVADLHLGMEFELAEQGINIPFQWKRMLGELVKIIKKYNPDRLILLGDVKHGVPASSFKEKQELPIFFNTLLEEVASIDITRGNHDANIQNFLPDSVRLHTSKGFIFGENFRVAVFHGHAWPSPEIISADAVIMAHNHPTLLLYTPTGITISKRAWIRGKLDPYSLAEAFLKKDNIKVQENTLKEFTNYYKFRPKSPELIIMPTFNDLLGGLPVNSDLPRNLLGPLFRSQLINIEGFDAYLLDGSYMGTIKFLRCQLNKGKRTLNYYHDHKKG